MNYFRNLKYIFVFLFLCISLSVNAQGTYYDLINPVNSTFVNDLKGRIRSPYTKVSYDNFDETNVANFASYLIGGSTRGVRCVYSWYEYTYTGTFSWAVFSREHTFCHSWMPTYPSESGDEYADQYHLFPTHQNGANGVRSNHPLGIVTTVTSTFLESKYGKNSSNQNVFEPRNQHKGDAARALLYMSIRYDGLNGNNWTFNYLNTQTLPNLTVPEAPQSVQLLLDWHRQDPPDKWEVDRNNYIQSIQENRNPFVDHPEYVNYIDFNDLTKLSPAFATEPSNHATGLSASVLNNTITLNWTGATGTNLPSGYLIQAYDENSYYIPIDGYSLAEDISLDSFKVKYVSHQSGANSYTFTGLTAGKTYYFSVFPYNSDGTSRNYYTYGTVPGTNAVSGTAILAAEPTNQATDLNTSNVSASTITLDWVDALAGSQAPSGYLILANNNNSFTDPTDGTVYTDDANLTDGSAVLNAGTGLGHYLFSSLSSSTTYYFRIYSYNGEGSSRNYKTDNVPSLNQTTTGSLVTPLLISEYVEGSSNNKAIELYNASTSTINLADYKIALFSNGANRPTASNVLTFTNPTNLNPGSTYVIANPSANASILALANLTNSTVINFNGDDALAIYKAADVTGTSISISAVEIDIFGKIGEDPGTSWSSGGVSTAEKTLRRKNTVYTPVTSNPATFNPSLEYDQFAVDTYDGLGAHLLGGNLTSSQEIPSRTYTNLTVNGSGINITLGGNITINGTLNLTNGNIILGSNDLTLGATSTISGTTSAANMIVANGTGKVIKNISGTGSFTFPVGDNTGAAEYSPVTLNFTSGSFGSGAYVSVNLKNEVHPANSTSSLRINRYWTIAQNSITSFNCDASFTMLDADVEGIGSQSDLYCWKYNDGWVKGNLISGNVLSFNSINSFSDFTGSGNDAPLPVSLSSFVSSVTNRNVKLNWVTESEVNNAGFDIERGNREQGIENSWKKVGYIDGHGTKNTPTSYSFEDKNLNTGKYKYRLKQIDHNGSYEYFELNGEVEVGVPKKYDLSQNYPNPFNPVTKINFDLPVDTRVSILIYDVTGREVARVLNNEFKKAGYYTTEFKAGNLSSGVYFYVLNTDNFRAAKKMIILK